MNKNTIIEKAQTLLDQYDPSLSTNQGSRLCDKMADLLRSIIDNKDPEPEIPKINLEQLCHMPFNERNRYLALTYGCSEDAYDCSTEEIAICGTDEEGFAEEESLVDLLMPYSDIVEGEFTSYDEEYLEHENTLELIQYGKHYLIDVVVNSAATSEPCDHYDFNTLRRKAL